MILVKVIKAMIEWPTSLRNKVVLTLTNTTVGSNVKIIGPITRRGKGLLTINSGVKINSNATTNPVGLGWRTMFYIAPKAKIVVGRNVGISTSLLYARESIIIEDNVLIGGGCQILDNDFHSIGYEQRVHNGDSNVKSSAILIEEGVFLGTNCIVLKGVTIGRRSVVAAGSVVSRSIPADEIWGGNPAKFIKKLS